MPRAATQFTPPAGIGLYQDVVVDGAVVGRGARDCAARWALIEPHVPACATVLDVGSNFGWYGLRTAQARAGAVVASFEADERSGLVQREVLRSHGETRVALLTRTFRAATLRRMAARGQRFDVVYLLAVLHWLPDFTEILALIDGMSGHVFVEHPAGDETDVGRPEVMRAIGDIETCLRRAFARRDVRSLGEAPGLTAEQRRTIWHVRPAPGWNPSTRAALDAAALVEEQPLWPPRSWWRQPSELNTGEQPPQLTSGGLVGTPSRELARRIDRLPEDYHLRAAKRIYRAARRTAGSWWRRCRMSLAG